MTNDPVARLMLDWDHLLAAVEHLNLRVAVQPRKSERAARPAGANVALVPSGLNDTRFQSVEPACPLRSLSRARDNRNALPAGPFGRSDSAANGGATGAFRLRELSLAGECAGDRAAASAADRLAGVLADRHSRRDVLLGAIVARSLILAGIAAAVAASAPLGRRPAGPEERVGRSPLTSPLRRGSRILVRPFHRFCERFRAKHRRPTHRTATHGQVRP